MFNVGLLLNQFKQYIRNDVDFLRIHIEPKELSSLKIGTVHHEFLFHSLLQVSLLLLTAYSLSTLGTTVQTSIVLNVQCCHLNWFRTNMKENALRDFLVETWKRLLWNIHYCCFHTLSLKFHLNMSIQVLGYRKWNFVRKTKAKK